MSETKVKTTELDNTVGEMVGVWKAYTPTVSSQTGTITTYTSSGFYTTIGKTIIGSGTFAITNNGSGATGIKVNLPINAKRSFGSGAFIAKEIAVTGKGITSQHIGSNLLYMTYSGDNSYPGGSGSNVIEFSFTYEAL